MWWKNTILKKEEEFMKKTAKWKMSVILMLSVLLAGSTAFGGVLFNEKSMVRQKCAACHKPDTQGRLEVIEETRKTMEEWKVVVDRMIRLNSAPLNDEDFYPVIKELSRDLCLTPAESRDVAYLNSDENSQYREIPKDDLEVRIYTACVWCHTYGKIKSHRNTLSQWNEVRNLHLGYYPTAVPQMREMNWRKESKELSQELSKLFPFDTPEYRAWLKNRKHQDLAGAWTIAGYQPGMGYYQGTYTLTPDTAKGDGEYSIQKTIQYQNGFSVSSPGTATLYSQYHLRYELAPTPLTGRIEGVFDLDADTGEFAGKWWTVVQDTNAYGNESFYRADGSARIMAAFPQSLKKNTGKPLTLTLVGVNLPANPSLADLTFSNAGIKALDIVKSGPSGLTVTVDVGKNASVDMVDIHLKNLTYKGLKVFEKVDAIAVSPRIGRARVSCGAAYPPQGVQFVARGISFGPDGKQGTADDLVLDPVNAQWRLSEEKTREDDDDMTYLDAPIANGLYTPVTTYGPIKTRKQHREGVGLIAVTASFENGSGTLTDKVKLAVTVPDFITHIK
jgi:quinohemoprotein amine dehydrogenase